MREKRWTGMDSATLFFPFRIGGGWYHVPARKKSRSLRTLQLLLRTKESIQQSVTRRCKGVDDGYTAPGEAVLQVIRQKQPATRLGCSRKNDGIPDAEAMVRRKIDS